MKKLIRHTYRHYHVNPDGSETYLGEVAYTLPAQETPTTPADAAFDTLFAKLRLEDELRRRQAEIDAFEALVDAACDGED